MCVGTKVLRHVLNITSLDVKSIHFDHSNITKVREEMVFLRDNIISNFVCLLSIRRTLEVIEQVSLLTAFY